MKPIWSILIPSISPRLGDFSASKILDIEKSINDRNIELLVLHDNKRRSIGGKRNALMQIARGDYISFIDDDDEIAPEYISSISNAILDNPDVDVITFKMEMIFGAIKSLLCTFGLDVPEPGHMNGECYYGPPSHIMCWKRKLIANIYFPDKNYAEDFEWITRARLVAKTSFDIDRTLYYYKRTIATNA